MWRTKMCLDVMRRLWPAAVLGLAILLTACDGGSDPAPVEADASVPKPAERPLSGPVEPEPEPAVSDAPDAPAAPAGAEVQALAILPVGKNPQQIAFSPDGAKAYVAAARSNRVTIVDARAHLVAGSIEAPGIPVGVGVLPDGDVLVSLFKEGRIERFDPETGRSKGSVETGEGSSNLVGPLADGTFLVSSERDKRFLVVDGAKMEIVASFPTGDRPFPPSVTYDGSMAFVTSYVEGTMVFVDLKRKMATAVTRVGSTPSGSAVLPGDKRLAVALREENRIAILDIESRTEVKSLQEGIGIYPFSVVVSPDRTLAFVNNNESNDISVIALPELEVIARAPVGPIPSAIAVHPSGETLWVSCEGDHQLYILEIPDRWRDRS